MRILQSFLTVWLLCAACAPVWADPTWVQWPSNNHYYAVIVAPGGISWTDANTAAQALDGQLASINSSSENDFVFSLIDDPQYWKPHTSFTSVDFNIGPWIGGHQPEGTPEPNGGWEWTSTEQLNFAAWVPGEPNEGPIPGQATENRICYWVRGSMTDRVGQWNDFHDGGCWDGDCVIAYVVERGCVTTTIAGPSGQSVCPGGTASFNVAPAGNGPFTYHWQKGSQPLVDDAHISGSATATLTITGATAADAGSYACLVSDSCGPVLSAAAQLLISSVIIDGPTAQSVCSGGTASFTVTPTGPGPFAFAWQKGGQPLVDDAHISGTGTATLTITAVTAADVASYACLIIDSCGSVLSSSAGLSISPAISVDGPSAQIVCENGTATFTVSPNSPGPFTYAWRKGDQPLADDAHISGSATATLTITGVTAVDADSYACLVTDSCGPVLSAAAELLVIPAVNINGPSSQSVCAGGNASFSVTVTPVGAGPFDYAWQKGGQPLADDAHIAGSNEPTLTITGVMAADVDSYACLITGPCGPILSAAADLVVLAAGTGDGDANGTVDGLDSAGFVAAVNVSPSVSPGYCAFDMNINGLVDAGDLSTFITVLLAE